MRHFAGDQTGQAADADLLVRQQRREPGASRPRGAWPPAAWPPFSSTAESSCSAAVTASLSAWRISSSTRRGRPGTPFSTPPKRTYTHTESSAASESSPLPTSSSSSSSSYSASSSSSFSSSESMPSLLLSAWPLPPAVVVPLLSAQLFDRPHGRLDGSLQRVQTVARERVLRGGVGARRGCCGPAQEDRAHGADDDAEVAPARRSECPNVEGGC